MSNNYADAINRELGHEAPAPVIRGFQIERTAPERHARRVSDTHSGSSPRLGKIESMMYRGVRFVVREHGVLSFWQMPDDCHKTGRVWNCYFSDEEIAVENQRGNIEGRIANVKAAIDRMHDKTPVWNGLWYKRGISI